MTDRDHIHATLDGIRARWRRRLALESLVVLTVVLVSLVVLAGLVWGLIRERDSMISAVRWTALLAVVVTALLLTRRWMARRPSSAQVALYVEERASDLRAALLSSVAVENDPNVSPGLAERVFAMARRGLASIDDGRNLEQERVRRAAGRFGGLILASGALLAFGPSGFRDATLSLLNPWRPIERAPVFTVDVVPGNAEVPKGGAVDVAAQLGGFTSPAAELVFRADSTAEWERIPMAQDTVLGRFTSRLFDVDAPVDYFIESEGVRSAGFRLTVVDLPAVRSVSATIEPPRYTGLPVESVETVGDLAVLTGSTVRLSAQPTRAARAAFLMVEGRAPEVMTIGPDGSWGAALRVGSDLFWRIDLVAEDGRRITGLQYAVDALDDAPPTVRFSAPGRDTKPTTIEEVTAQVEAFDDFGVRRLLLHVSVNGAAPTTRVLTDTTARALRDVAAAHTFFLEEWSLKPGDLISYHAEAIDGAGQAGVSDMYFLEIRPFDRTYREAEQSGMPGGGGGGEDPDGLAERQRLVVVGTFNVTSDSAGDARSYRENVTTLAIGEGRIRQEVAELRRRMAQRGMAGVDSTFVEIGQALDSAAVHLQEAEERLGRHDPRAALPAAQQALTHLQRAEAAYREVQVSRGNQQGGGGGGGQQRNAEELADLFELETDRLENQYESMQRDQGAEAERTLDETAERLRRLAARQQQENERMARMADAMRNRSSQGGGGSNAQRQLADETAEAARQLERLARERQDQGMADAARRLRDAADRMRRAAGTDPQGAPGQGNEALEQLRDAARQLERSRSEGRQNEVRQLEARAEALQQRQRETAEQATSLPADPAERRRRAAALGERKEEMARDAEQLAADAERLSRDAAREQPAAARKLAEAAEGMRTDRVGDKLRFSQSLLQRGSQEYVRQFEEQISENLADAAGRLREAARALGQAEGSRENRAMERARDLVRGLESLNERARAEQRRSQGAAQGPGESREPSPGEQSPPAGGARSGAPDGADAQPGRQFGREFRVRRQAAESLRADLRAIGEDTAPLDRVLQQFRQLDDPRTFQDPAALDRLERDLIAGLKEIEFALWRRFGDGAGQRPAAGATARVPPQYRELVEEYYRALARQRPTAAVP
ncbi:MAG: DUF4175 family protein [Gemmatimonadales bacterium]